MLYGNYVFSCRLESDAILPVYKGSTFRGVFGTALKRVVCALKLQDCKDCLLRNKCVYSLAFETPGGEYTNQDSRRIPSPPHPYVIEPSFTTKTHYKKGEPFEFTLILFGKINDYLPYFIYAIEQMGMIGIGKKIDGKRPGFALERIAAEDKSIIYSSHDKKVRNGDFSRNIYLHDVSHDTDESAEGLEIKIETPLRLKFRNRLEANLPFHILIRTALRRISSLYNYYGNGEPALNYKDLVKRADDIKIEDSAIEWVDWKRYSNKQEQSMLMGGIVGTVSYTGDLAEFLPLLRLCETFHMGKQTTFGLGKLTISKVW
ncbi:MAG: CRISPR system precrRNA processing endoribonuclease RAMP protein Cas6 [Syntrophaceae bacterium]|nr:CRISPR system precrRNA processing endoribonuclease RAMP protein Cas6 [Syntrophaceae bacterium]